MMNDWKDRLGVVYSTAADFDYRTAESEEAETLAPAAQQLRVRIEKKRSRWEDRDPCFGICGHECRFGRSRPHAESKMWSGRQRERR